MAAEIDVFYIPHLRMKQLVNTYLDKVRLTDFSNNLAVESLLRFLHDTFIEVKCHEDIEDGIILKKLQSRLKSLCVDNVVVHNCHKDIHIGQMITLINDGISITSKSSEDCLAFGNKLRQAVKDFTTAFLPHLREEEEVFQPLLVKYFEHRELQIIRKLVIVEHCTLTNNLIYETLWVRNMDLGQDEVWGSNLQSGSIVFDNGKIESEKVRNEVNNSCNQNVTEKNELPLIADAINVVIDIPEELADQSKTVHKVQKNTMIQQFTIFDLPGVPMTKIFSYLNPPDLVHCAQVCHEWNNLVYQPILWRRVCPVQWALGYWDYVKDWIPEQHKAVITSNRSQTYDTTSTRLDDLASLGLPIIIPGNPMEEIKPNIYTDLVKRLISEFRVISGLLRFVLWRVGTGVKELNLGSSCILNDCLLNMFMLQCPNIEHLDVSYTSLSFRAFYGVKENGSCRLLTKICFSGCHNLEDSAIISLTKCWENEEEEVNDELMEKDMKKEMSSMSVLSTVFTENDFIKTLLAIIQRKPYPSNGRENEQIFVSIPYVECKRKPKVSGLETLILSGCSKLTDKSPEELTKMNKAITKLRVLDMSGCYRFSARTLNFLVEKCPHICPEFLFYCDHIKGGPYSNEANGCNNLQSRKRACCIKLE